ncbi:alcohol dehydrogenase-like protein [Hyaloscypha bicolor E]|uniref:Alcohol dehydrogenase-like protein n=1 Tax=Hyaloscypha bicolor E TaxID=1095630 RepID=A0A2J6SM65_9HELO|nr:alcohol dehydrogenase-like protein [Hyaloscypha bicolor E]PMD51847.1 alcohol dehydrogenase-like protein [Hyaloscypha bicolor E]
MAAEATQKTFDIPKTYKAAVYDKPGTISTRIVELNTPDPGPGDVLVRLTHSGVCHSDMGVMENSWRGLPYPTQPGQIGGHEGVGVVHKLGPGSDRVKVGDRVGIKWIAYACGACPPCLEGRDGVCFNQKISGYYHPGTFQQYALAPANYVTPIPDSLSSEDAAPMLCAGVTTYSALRKSDAKSGQWAVIVGAGGGLGHLATQIGSRGMAMRIIGIDHGSKESLVKECGAEVFLDITKFDDKTLAEEVKKVTGGLGASAVIVCTASNNAYAQALDFLRFGGTLVCVGMPEGDMVPIAKAFPAMMVAMEHNIKGSAVGNQREAIEVLEMAARGVVKTRLRIEKMEKLTEVFQEMSEGKMQGRVVLDLQ